MSKLKPRAVPAFIFLLLIGAAQSVSASDWVEIFEDIDGWVYSIDRDSIQTKSYSSIVSVWEKVVLPNESSLMFLLEFDFSDRTYRILARYEYDSNDRQTNSATTPSEWKHIIPDTVAEAVYQTLKDLLNR